MAKAANAAEVVTTLNMIAEANADIVLSADLWSSGVEVIFQTTVGPEKEERRKKKT
jgi:uroporphyrinogen-III decarboxylase